MAQLILGGLRAIIAEVPDLMSQCGVLRVKQRERNEDPQGAHESHPVLIPDTQRFQVYASNGDFGSYAIGP